MQEHKTRLEYKRVAPILLQKIVEEFLQEIPISNSILWTQHNSAIVEAMDLYSASVEDQTKIRYFRELQEMRLLPRNKM